MAKREYTPEQKERNRERCRAWNLANKERVKREAHERYLRAQRTPEEKAKQAAYAREWHAKRAASATPEQKAAKAAYNREWAEKHKEERREYMRQRAPHVTPERKAERAEYQAQWRKDNADSVREKKRAYHLANQEAMKAKTRAWRLANPERSAAKVRECHLKTPEKTKAAARKWAELHPEELAAHSRNQFARRKRAAPDRHAPADITRLYELQKGMCTGCKAVLINKKGKGKYHVDHVMPLILGGSNGPENLQLLCPRCNQTKSAKHPDEWARELGRLFT